MSPQVTLLVWRIPPAKIPIALWRIARDGRRLRRDPNVTFAKLVGTGRDFGPDHPDLTRWAAVLVHTAEPNTKGWDRIATARCRIDLKPLATRGTWAGQEPFVIEGQPPNVDLQTRRLSLDHENPEGLTLALTRARLRMRRAKVFWRALKRPAQEVHQAPGLLATFGFGESPVGWQGTISLWRTARDLVEFAYRNPAHRQVITDTSAQRWYAEELFARFAVVHISGDRRVIGWTSREGS